MSSTKCNSSSPVFIANTMCGKVCITLVALWVSLLSLSPHKKHLSWNPGNWGGIAQKGLTHYSISGGGGSSRTRRKRRKGTIIRTFLSMLFNDAFNWSDYTASVTEECMSVEKWWNDTDMRKINYTQKNLSRCHFVSNKFHMDWIKHWSCNTAA
jgi:hypothetical protein